MVKEIKPTHETYKSVISAIRKASEDCRDEDVDRVTSVVKTLIETKPDIRQLQKIHSTITSQVDVISRSRTPSPSEPLPSLDSPTLEAPKNLLALAEKVEKMIHHDCPDSLALLFGKGEMDRFKKGISTINDPEILFQIALHCAEENPSKTAVFIKLFKIGDNQDKLLALAMKSKTISDIHAFIKLGLTSKNHIYLLLAKLAVSDTKLAINFLKKYPIQDKKYPPSLLSLFATHDGLYFASNIKLFEIASTTEEDQALLAELARDCVMQNGAAAQFIKNFEINDSKVRLEIAKLCAEKDGFECAKHILQFDFDPETKEGQQALFEVAQLCLKQNAACAEHLSLFKIKEPKLRFKLAELCAKKDGGVFAKHFKQFEIKEPTQVFELAKLAAACYQPQDKLFIENIENFDIKDLKLLFEIAKLCARSKPASLIKQIRKFKLDSEQHLELAHECLKLAPIDVLQSIVDKSFKISDPDAIYEIVLKCAALNGELTLHFASKLKIEDPEKKYEIARRCIQQSGRSINLLEKLKLPRETEKQKKTFIELIKIAAKLEPDFTMYALEGLQVQEEKDRAEIAELCIIADPEEALSRFREFKITDPKLCEHLADVAVKADSYYFSMNMKLFDQLKPEKKLELAYRCAKRDGAATADFIGNYDIKDSAHLLEIAKICAANGWNPSAKGFEKFGIKDKDQIQSIVEISILKGYFTKPSEVDTFGFSAEENKRLYFLAFCSNFLNNALDDPAQKEFDQKVYAQIKAYIEAEDKMNIDGEFMSLKKILGLSKENKKEYCTLFLAVNLLGFKIEDERSISSLRRICECRNGELALSLALKLTSKSFSRKFYYQAVENPGSLKIEDHLLLPLVYPSAWVKKGENEHLFLAIRKNLDSGAIKKSLSGSGGSVEQAWLKTCKLLDETSTISLNQKLELLLTITSNLNPKDPKGDLLGRLNSLEVIVSSKRADLIEFISSLTSKVQDLEIEIQKLAPELRLLDEVKIEQALLDVKAKNLKAILEQAKVAYDKTVEGGALIKLKQIQERYLERKKQGETSAELEEKIESAKKQIEKHEEWLNDWIKEIHPTLEDEIKEVEARQAKLSEDAAFLSKFQHSVKKRSKEIDKLEKRLKAAQKEKADVLSKLSKKTNVSSNDKLVRQRDRLELEIKNLEEQVSALKRSVENEEKIKALQDEVNREISQRIFDSLKTILSNDPYLDLSSVESLESRFLETLNQMRFPNAWKIYQIRMERTSEKEIQIAFQRFIIGVLEGTFKQDRYSPELSSHITKIAERFPKIWEGWQIEDRGEQVKISDKQYLVVNTDDWQDLFLSGTDVEGSCQHVAGSPQLNKCLLGYTNDGKNRMIAIKDPKTGKIVARTIIKMLWSKETQKPVLYLEAIYPHKASKEMKDALANYAMKEAKRLGCPLYASEDLTGTRQKNTDCLQSFESQKAPYEYSDSSGGPKPHGAFDVVRGYLLV